MKELQIYKNALLALVWVLSWARLTSRDNYWSLTVVATRTDGLGIFNSTYSSLLSFNVPYVSILASTSSFLV